MPPPFERQAAGAGWVAGWLGGWLRCILYISIKLQERDETYPVSVVLGGGAVVAHSAELICVGSGGGGPLRGRRQQRRGWRCWGRQV